MLPGVVAQPGRVVAPGAHVNHQLLRVKHHGVQKSRATLAHISQRFEKRRRLREGQVLDLDEWVHWQCFQAQPQGITQGAVGVRKAVKQVLVRVVGRAVQHLARRQQHIEFQHGVMHQACLERGGFNAHPSGSAPYRDGFELRHHGGHHAMRQCVGHQRVVRCEAFHVNPTLAGVDVQHMAKVLQVEPIFVALLAVTKQVGAVFDQAQRCCVLAQPRV